MEVAGISEAVLKHVLNVWTIWLIVTIHVNIISSLSAKSGIMYIVMSHHIEVPL